MSPTGVHFFPLASPFILGLHYAAQYPSHITSIRSQDVLRVVQAYLHPQHSFLVIVANLQKAGVQ